MDAERLPVHGRHQGRCTTDWADAVELERFGGENVELVQRHYDELRGEVFRHESRAWTMSGHP